MRDDRNRQAESLEVLDRLDRDCPDGSPGMLLKTKTCTTYPTTAGRAYCCNPVFLSAADTEGATPSFWADTDVTIYAVNLGSEIPPAGSYVIASGVGGRFCFRWDVAP